MTQADWIAVDWGQTGLRLWRLDADNRVLFTRHSDRGVAGLKPQACEAALIAALGDAVPDTGRLTVICCGAIGAPEGWVQAPYVPVPCAPPGLDRATRVATQDARLDVHILPGLRQDRPADEMRGDETRIAGYLAQDPRFDGVLCLPGAHTRWAHISAGEIVSFRSFMTGEWVTLLAQASILRQGLRPDGWEDDAFQQAVGDAMARPQGVAAELMSIRAASLLQGQSGDAANARLWGLMIGLELAGARPHWLGQDVRVVGSGQIATAYAIALRAQGTPVQRVDDQDMTLHGLIAARGTPG